MLPTTYLGKASFVLAAANILLTLVSFILLARGDLGTNANPVNTWVGSASGILAIAALVVGITSIVRSKERPKLLYLALALILLIFLLGEFIYPH